MSTTRIALPRPRRGRPSTKNVTPTSTQRKNERDEGQVQEEPVEVLEDERKGGLHPIAPMDRRLPDGARRRIGEIEPVVGLPVVVAGDPEPDRDPQDQERRADSHDGQPHRGATAARRTATGSRPPRTAPPNSGVQSIAAEERVGAQDREPGPLDAQRRHPPVVEPARATPRPCGAVPAVLRGGLAARRLAGSPVIGTPRRRRDDR